MMKVTVDERENTAGWTVPCQAAGCANYDLCGTERCPTIGGMLAAEVAEQREQRENGYADLFCAEQFKGSDEGVTE